MKKSPSNGNFMADTMSIGGMWELKRQFNQADWKLVTTKRGHRDVERTSWRAYRPANPHLTFYGTGERKMIIERVECSLPYLLHGTNGVVINTEADFRAAINLMQTTLDSISTPIGESRPLVSRLDFAWQIRGEVTGILAAMERIKLRGGRKIAEVRPDESIRWKLGDFCLQVYNKTKQIHCKKPFIAESGGEVLRIELQLRSKRAIEHAFQIENLSPDDLSLEMCYQAFRNFLIDRLPEVSSAQCDAGNMTRSGLFGLLVAYCAEKEFAIEGEPALAFVNRMLAPTAARKLRSEIGTARLTKYRFSPKELFPERLSELQGVSILENGNLMPVGPVSIFN